MKKYHPNCIALIPARSGSKRIKDKNIKILAGHPLIAYSISSAIKSNIFSRVIVSTDSPKIAEIAKYYGADVPFLRPNKFATDTSPDIEWVKFTLEKLEKGGQLEECFSILRPTSPFRTTQTIKKAWKKFYEDKTADSIRAVELCTQHPAKMWKVEENRMKPVMKGKTYQNIEWHSTPYQALPPIYAQNASLEIAWSRVVFEKNSISGDEIMPFLTKDYEGFDINDERDWIYAEYLIRSKRVCLHKINIKPFKL